MDQLEKLRQWVESAKGRFRREIEIERSGAEHHVMDALKEYDRAVKDYLKEALKALRPK